MYIFLCCMNMYPTHVRYGSFFVLSRKIDCGIFSFRYNYRK
ncbi:hypothetical protein HMPREF9406_2500 [Clostridium sp. HGF2]|nr:hypothetical protein HMPREF9406_2500 [Clostridium sp. HGF2]EQJ53455.1 hypothetical protein QSI_3570 [Clostridioides difficile P28]